MLLCVWRRLHYCFDIPPYYIIASKLYKRFTPTCHGIQKKIMAIVSVCSGASDQVVAGWDRRQQSRKSFASRLRFNLLSLLGPPIFLSHSNYQLDGNSPQHLSPSIYFTVRIATISSDPSEKASGTAIAIERLRQTQFFTFSTA